jgi:cytochrome c oxidase cbb3-type subunit 3
MSEQERLLDHEYDGIQEYDNPTPSWWHLIFIGSIIFSFFYFAFYQWSPLAPDMYERHAASEARVLKAQFAEIGQLEPDQATILEMMGEEKWMTVAASIFQGNCVSCHGANGQGIVGPNLTDDSYKNVTQITDIYSVIADGAANGAMPAWKNRLHPNEMVLLASYVATLRGNNAPGRGPEGERIDPWPAPEGS